MTIDDVREMTVERFCAVIKAALWSELITGGEAIELIKLYYLTLLEIR